MAAEASKDWTKSPAAAEIRLANIRRRLGKLKPTLWPRQNVCPDRWGIFLIDVKGCKSSIYMMRHGAFIPLVGRPFLNDPRTFPRMEVWQQAAALEVVYKFVKEGKVLGPLPGTTRCCPISGKPLYFYPSFVVPKSKPGSYRWVLNASYNRVGSSINDHILDYSTSLVGFKDSLYPCLRTQFISRLDLRRAFKQLFRACSQLHLLATMIGDHVFIDATMSMGLRNTCKLFEEDFMKAFIKGLIHHHPELFSDGIGPLVDNYLDDIWFLAKTSQRNKLQLMIAEYWANWLGIELNHEKRELPTRATRHLGFNINLHLKMVTITMKHRLKILNFFSRLMLSIRRNCRIPILQIQKMLGLQIWVSTVFRVARQFLTSTCDILRKFSQLRLKFLYPRLEQVLVARLVVDLKVWRRFVLSSPQASFEFLLGQLPVNPNILFSDACSSFGMAGVILLSPGEKRKQGVDGLCWQITWEEWRRTAPMARLRPGSVEINVAEFLAALITCETFVNYCTGTFTRLSLDSYAAKGWIDAARCPIHPFDRCAQGIHLYLLDNSVKICTRWISSGDNAQADFCSRIRLASKPPKLRVAGLWLRKVRPLWHNVLKHV